MVVEVSVYEEGVMGEGHDNVIEDEVLWGNVVCGGVAVRPAVQ